MRRVPSSLAHEPEAITYVRSEKGLTKTALAAACQVSVSLITELEHGTRSASPELINRMAEVLGCPRVILVRRRDAA